MSDLKFMKGIMVFSPNVKAPDFVKAEIVINTDEFIKFIQDNPDIISKHDKYGNQVKLTMKSSRDGKLYLEINNYNAKKSQTTDEF